MSTTSDYGMTAVTDPSQVNRLAQQVMSEDDGVGDRSLQVDEAAQHIKQQFMRPVENTYELPAGLYNPLADITIREFEVRELNGADEEALARVKSDGKMLNTMLERALVRLGDEKVTPSLLSSMLTGDRDAVLLAIRRSTFGDDLELSVVCPHCEKAQEVVLSIENDIPVVRLEDSAPREVYVSTKQGEVEMVLPTGDVQAKLYAGSEANRTIPELNTILLAGCVRSVDGKPVLRGEDAVRTFGVKDRQKLLLALTEANPGPRLGEVSRSCEQCEKDIPLPLSMPDIFRA